MSAAIDVKVTMNLDVPAIVRRLTAGEAKVLRTHRSQIIAEIQKRWRGWVYKGRGLIGRGTSMRGWKGTVQGTVHPFSLTIANEARTRYGRGYVAYVHRAGTSADDLEYLKVFQWLRDDRSKSVERDLTAAILASIAAGATAPMKQINPSTPGPLATGSTLI